MLRANAEVQFLPSLLDRLTDDDPVTESLKLHQKKINKLENELVRITNNSNGVSVENRRQLEKKLEKERHASSILSSSINSLKEIRQCVIRDLDWLLNAHNYSPPEELESYPEVIHSVVNYGLPDFTGLTASSVDVYQLEKVFRQALLDFEPRIMKNNLKVRLIADESMQDHNALVFEIDAEVWSDPLPIHLHLRSEVELESGAISLAELDQ